MSDIYTGLGTLSNEKTVTLDKPAPVASGRVRVTVEILSGEQAGNDQASKLQAIRQALHASGYRARTKDQIDAQIRAERDSWEAH